MNFKKFISGVSALAIAASAFAAMAVTANAATNTLMEYGTDDVAWTAAGLATWTAGGSPAFDDADDPTYVQITGSNGSYATSKTITPTANSIINVSAVWRGRSNTGRYFTNGNGSYFRFGNIVVAQNDQTQRHGYTFDGLDNMAGVTTFSATPYRTDIANCVWLKIDMEINTATDTLTSFTIKSEDGNTTYVSVSDQALTAIDYTTVAFGYRRAGSVSTTNAEQLKSIKITETTQEVSTADYTVNYTLNGTTVDSDTGNKADGASVEARTGYFDHTDSTTGETTRYYIEDGATTSFTIDAAGTNVFTVPVRAADVYTVSAVASTGAVIKAATSVTEGDTFSYTYPKYLTDANNRVTSVIDGASTYGKTETPSDDTTYTVAYTAYAGTAYFYEAESNGGNAGISSNTYSNGSAVRRLDQRQVKITVPETGVYSVTIGFACDRSDNSATDTLSVYNGNYSAEATPIYEVTDTRYNTYRGSSDTHSNISLTAGDTLTLYTASWNLGADYVLLEKSVVAAVASTPQILGTYTSGEGKAAKAYTFTVTPNDETITSVTVTDANDSTKTETKTFDGGLSGPGTITFGIVVTATDVENLNKTFTVELN